MLGGLDFVPVCDFQIVDYDSKGEPSKNRMRERKTVLEVDSGMWILCWGYWIHRGLI